jgi:hypothetical protein
MRLIQDAEVTPGPGPSTSPSAPARFGLRHIAFLALTSVGFAAGMNWQVVATIGRDFPQRLNDPMFQAWLLAWDGHAVLHHPTGLFQANIFWPLRDTLAFSDTLLGYVPVGLIGHGPHAALVRYNVLFLFSYALAFAGAFLLAREIGLRWAPAAVAGAAFAYAPWRLAQNAHLHVLSSGGIPLAIFLVLRGWRTKRSGLVLAGWLVASWQISLGFAIGLGFGYLMAALTLMAALAWLRAGRPESARTVVLTTIAGVIVFAGVGFALSRPYYRVERAYPEVQQRQSESALRRYSPPPKGYAVAAADNVVWGRFTKSLRRSLTNPDEQALYPGVVTVGLAALGVGTKRFPRRWRFGLLAVVVVMGLLALGTSLAPTRGLYLFLWRNLPGWRSTRTPGRLTTFVSLGLAILAGFGAERLTELRIWKPSARMAVASFVVIVVLVQGLGDIPHVRPPDRPPALGLATPPAYELPSEPPVTNATYEYWSVDGFPPLVNGYSGLFPIRFEEIRRMTLDFPSATSVGYLRALGVRTVVLHIDLAPGTPWQDAAATDTSGLGIRVRRVGRLVIYDLES